MVNSVLTSPGASVGASVGTPVGASVGLSVGKGVRDATVDAAMDSSQSDSKLKYVIMFGAPVVAGIALYWYMSRRKGQGDKGGASGLSSETPKKDIRADGQRKIDEQLSSKVR